MDFDRMIDSYDLEADAAAMGLVGHESFMRMLLDDGKTARAI